MQHVINLCSNLEKILWGTELQTAYIGEYEVHVWRATVYNHLSRVNDYTNLLAEKEKLRLHKYHQFKDQERYIVRTGILRILLGLYLNVDAADIVMSPGVSNKPFVANPVTNLQFNLTFSNDYILFAFAHSAVGIDVEKIDLNFNYTDITGSLFNEQERKYIDQDNSPLHGFYRLWTRKEALVKATSIGVTNDLVETGCITGQNLIGNHIIGSNQDWKTGSFEVAKDYIGSVAHLKTTTLKFFDFDSFVNEADSFVNLPSNVQS